MYSRRQFCATTTIGLGSSLLLGTASAQSDTTTVTATVESAFGSSLTDSHVVFVNQETVEWYRADIAKDGSLQTSVPSGYGYDVVFFNQPQGSAINPEFNGVPVVQDLDSIDVGDSEKALGSYTVPEGHVAQLRIENEAGNPLQNVPLSFSTPSGAGVGSGDFTTNENGYVFHVENSQPGIELAGSVTMRTHGAGGKGGVLAQLFVDSDMSSTAVLRNPDDYANIIEREGTAGTATSGIVEQEQSTPDPSAPDQAAAASVGDGASARRGFLSNSGDEPPLLSNPTNLTIGGFVLSVGGIVYQMVGGK
jgi:hypothetical protein